MAALVALASPFAACLSATEPEDTPNIPEGVAWVAFVPEVAGAAGSALWPYRADQPLVYPVDTGRPWRVVGYGAELLDTYAIDASRAQLTPLAWAEPDACGQLPSPLWDARVTPGPSPSGPPHVLAAWSRTCEAAPASLPGGVDVRCAELPACGATFARDQCRVTFDRTACGGREFVAEVVWAGPACLAAQAACARVASDTPGAARWQCGDCEVETYPVTPLRTLTPRSRRLATPTPNQVPVGQLVPGVQLRQLEQGAASALALRGREAWVAVRRSPAVSHRTCAIDEMSDNDGLIVRLDREALAPVGTSSAAGRCITRLVPDPLGPGMLATFYLSDVLYLGRYGARGEPLAAVPLERMTPTSERVDRAVAMVVTSSRTTVVVEYFERSGDAVDDGMVYVLDTATLETTGRAIFRDGPVRGVAWAAVPGAVEVVVANVVVRLAVDSLQVLSTAELSPLAFPLYPHVLEDGRVLVSDPIQSHGVVEVGTDRRVRSVSRVSTYSAVVTDLLVWPGEQEGLAMLLTTPDSGRTSQAGLARVSLDGGRGVRLAPQVWQVLDESGAPLASALTQPVLDAEGRLWALAPWTGHVLRFDVLPER